MIWGVSHLADLVFGRGIAPPRHMINVLTIRDCPLRCRIVPPLSSTLGFTFQGRTKLVPLADIVGS